MALKLFVIKMTLDYFSIDALKPRIFELFFWGSLHGRYSIPLCLFKIKIRRFVYLLNSQTQWNPRLTSIARLTCQEKKNVPILKFVSLLPISHGGVKILMGTVLNPMMDVSHLIHQLNLYPWSIILVQNVLAEDQQIILSLLWQKI